MNVSCRVSAQFSRSYIARLGHRSRTHRTALFSCTTSRLSFSSWTVNPIQTNEEKHKYYQEKGIQHYSRDVARTVGANITLTACSGAATVATLTALMATTNANTADVIMAALPFTTLTATGGCLYHAYQLDTTHKSESERETHSRWMHGLLGFALAPSLVVFSDFIPQASLLTLALTLGPVTASYHMKDNSLLKIGPALHTCLWGIVGAGVTSIVAPGLGLHHLADISHDVSLYGGLGLFTLLNAYDTHVMIEDYKSGRTDRVGHAANYSLNMINIFLRLLEILSNIFSTVGEASP